MNTIYQELARTEHEARQLSRIFGVADDPETRYEGRDGRRTVAVSIGSDGTVHDVAVLSGWRNRTDDLGGAVREAAADAVTARLTAWGGSVAQASHGARRTGAQRPTMPAGANPDLTRHLARAAKGMGRRGSERAMHELLTMFEQLETAMDAVSNQFEEHRSATYTGYSRHVTVEVGGGQITGVRYDQPWLVRAHEITIGRETVRAARAAYQAAERHSVQALIADSPLGRLQRLTQNPVALTTRLGLRGQG